MPSEERAAIFEKFYRASNTAHAGAGDGGGSVFRLFIPIADGT